MAYQPNYYGVQSYSPTPQYQPQMYMQPQIPMINGKIVDSKEMVNVMDVPIGSYGVYPKGDMSAVYIKTWKSDGSTQIDTYERCNAVNDTTDVLDDIYNSLDALSKKIDSLSKPTTTTTRRKKVAVDDK